MNKKKEKTTIQDVANTAGVSIATVSRVLNNPENVRETTRAKVLDTMRLLGYRYYERYPDGFEPKRLLLLVAPLTSDSSNDLFFSKVIDGVDGAAKRNGYEFVIHKSGDSQEDLQHIIKILQIVQASGVICLNHVADKSFFESIVEYAPVVQCFDYQLDWDVSQISIDDFEVSKALVSYAISRGKKKIAIINGNLRYGYAKKRQKGYLAALEEAGIEARKEWIFNLDNADFGPATSAATQLLNLDNRPDAVFAVSDVFAASVIKVGLGMGLRVPEDLGVIGFDNTAISLISVPSITTVNYPKQRMGSLACELLIQQINNPNMEKKHLILDTEIIVRESI